MVSNSLRSSGAQESDLHIIVETTSEPPLPEKRRQNEVTCLSFEPDRKMLKGGERTPTGVTCLSFEPDIQMLKSGERTRNDESRNSISTNIDERSNTPAHSPPRDIISNAEPTTPHKTSRHFRYVSLDSLCYSMGSMDMDDDDIDAIFKGIEGVPDIQAGNK
mmetsp:Transcript_19645/g.26103  ORF Transcript_19645/g.26103 Transcript_19645/m.26103 type:complete len:162 (+) Transcript_19645:96-581(+)